MKSLLSISLLIVVLFSFTGCKKNYVYSPENRVYNGIKADDSTIYNAIVSGASKKGWRVTKIKPGLAEATITVRSHYAKVQIPYTNTRYSIKYVESRNLKYNAAEKTIHRNYNGWVKRLEAQLRVSLSRLNYYKASTRYASNTTIKKTKKPIKRKSYSRAKDFKELDRLIRSAEQAPEDRTKWLFIVGIEQYEFTDNISYAKRSATTFKKAMKKKLGVPEQNIYSMIDHGATQAKVKTNLKRMLRRVKNGDTIYFYYNGHGIPVPSQKYEPYMLTSDSEPDFIADEEFFALKNIYGKLSASKANKVVAVVDSCFSGVTDGKSVLKGVAATKMKAKSVTFDKDKMVVLSAGKSHQYSNAFNRKGHRLFSFYVMQNLLEGDLTVKSLYENTKRETYDTSLIEYGDIRVQEPTIDGNFRLAL